MPAAVVLLGPVEPSIHMVIRSACGDGLSFLKAESGLESLIEHARRKGISIIVTRREDVVEAGDALPKDTSS